MINEKSIQLVLTDSVGDMAEKLYQSAAWDLFRTEYIYMSIGKATEYSKYINSWSSFFQEGENDAGRQRDTDHQSIEITRGQSDENAQMASLTNEFELEFNRFEKSNWRPN